MKRGIRRRELEEKYVGFQKHLIDLKENMSSVTVNIRLLRQRVSMTSCMKVIRFITV